MPYIVQIFLTIKKQIILLTLISLLISTVLLAQETQNKDGNIASFTLSLAAHLEFTTYKFVKN